MPSGHTPLTCARPGPKDATRAMTRTTEVNHERAISFLTDSPPSHPLRRVRRWLRGARLATHGQRAREWDEDEKADNRDHDHHDDHLRVVEVLPADHQRGRDISLRGAQCHHSPGIWFWPAKNPADTDPHA